MVTPDVRVGSPLELGRSITRTPLLGELRNVGLEVRCARQLDPWVSAALQDEGWSALHLGGEFALVISLQRTRDAWLRASGHHLGHVESRDQSGHSDEEVVGDVPRV